MHVLIVMRHAVSRDAGKAPLKLIKAMLSALPLRASQQVGLAALKGIKKKKRRSTPSSPSYSDGLTPTAVSSRPSKFQAVTRKQPGSMEPSADSAMTGSSRQAAAAAATAALPRQLTQQQQQQPTYDGYTYSYATVPVGSGGGISSSSYSQVGGSLASAAALGHQPGCMAMAGGMCSCWSGTAAGVQAYSPASLAAPGAAVGGYVNCPDGSLQPAQLQPWQQQQQQMGDGGYGAPEVTGSPFQLFGSGSSMQELAGSSTRLQSAGGASTAAGAAAAAPAGMSMPLIKAEVQSLTPQAGSCAPAGGGSTQQPHHDHQQPSSSSMSSGSPVRPGLVNSCGTVTPPAAGGSMDRAHSINDVPAASSSRTTATPMDTSAGPGRGSDPQLDGKMPTGLLGPHPTGAWGSQGLVMAPPSDALGPLGLRPLGQGKLLSPAAYDMLMSGIVPSSRGGVEVQYQNGSSAAAGDGMGPAMQRSSSMTSPGRQQQQPSAQLQLQHSMPAPTTAFGSSGGGYGPPPGPVDASRGSSGMAGLNRSFSYDVSCNPMGAPTGPIPGPNGSAGGGYGPPAGAGPVPYMSMGGGSSGGYDPSLPPMMQRVGRSYSTPPGYGPPPPMGPYGRPSGGGGCGVPGCIDPACWGYAGPEAPPGMLPPGMPLPYGPSGGLPGPYPPGPGQPGMLPSYGSAPPPGSVPVRRSGSLNGLPEGFMTGMQYGQGGRMQEQGDALMGLPPTLLADAPATVMLAKQQAAAAAAAGGSSGGAGRQMGSMQQQQHQQQHPGAGQQQQQQRQPPPSTPAFSWDSVGEALQGFGEGADDSLAWDDLTDFDLPDLKQHEVDELLNL